QGPGIAANMRDADTRHGRIMALEEVVITSSKPVPPPPSPETWRRIRHNAKAHEAKERKEKAARRRQPQPGRRQHWPRLVPTAYQQRRLRVPSPQASW
ncbi:hypothetical protein V494_08013, partial [Pseudogymnoascus sp. VKM F-4513 (FW-928)]